MTLEFFTYLLAFGYILYKANIITREQLIQIVEISNNNSEKTIENIIEDMWNVIDSPPKKEKKNVNKKK